MEKSALMMSRRAFCAMAGAAVAGGVAQGAPRVPRYREIVVPCGLAKPVRVLHVSDTHLTAMNEAELRDPRRKWLYEERRHKTFPARPTDSFLAEAVAYAKANGLLLVHTGDLADFASEPNFEAIERFTANPNVFCIMGNHEPAYFMYTQREDIRFNRALLYARYCRVLRHDADCSARVLGGVNFVGFDNWDFQVSPKQDAFLREEIGRGLPTVLLCHCPFYTPNLHAALIAETKARGGKAFSECIGIPPEEHARIAKENRNEMWRIPTETTNRFAAWLPEQGNLKAILCGHLHRFHAERYSPSAMQYVVGANSRGDGEIVTFA